MFENPRFYWGKEGHYSLDDITLIHLLVCSSEREVVAKTSDFASHFLSRTVDNDNME